MKSNFLKASAFVIFVLLLFTFPSLAQQEKIVGNWRGALKISTIQLRIVFNVTEKDSGQLSATLDSPDQNAFGIPVSEVIYNFPSVKFIVQSIAGSFEGTLDSTDNIIAGKWNQGGRSFDLELSRSDSVIKNERPQEPKPPYPYNEEEVLFVNSIGDTLSGTLSLPASGQSFVGVVLVSGSGPQNRDEELLGHKPFLVLADYLTRNGIAVLRFDDRGVGKSKGNFSEATTLDFVDDALAAVRYLMSRHEIESIGIIGHSEGGLVAPLAAIDSDDIDFIVMLAGPGISGKEILLLQTELILRANGQSEEQIQNTLKLNKDFYDIAISDLDSTSAVQAIRIEFENAYDKMTDMEKQEIGSKENFIKQQSTMLLSKWFKYFLAYNPYETLKKVKCPVLALNGEKDLQVPPRENLSAIEKAFIEAEKTNYKVIELPGLNHLFQTAGTGSPMEYSTIEETFSPAAMEIIADWIKVLEN